MLRHELNIHIRNGSYYSISSALGLSGSAESLALDLDSIIGLSVAAITTWKWAFLIKQDIVLFVVAVLI
jgi:hypothetical protein